jgi:hypothetical protein
MAKLSDFTKQQIQECYNEMYDYVTNLDSDEDDFDPDDFDDEDEFDDDEDENYDFMYMVREIEKREISIPEDIYKKICDFVKEKLAPTSVPDKTAGFIYGNQARVQCENALKEFGKKELYPLLTEE